MRVRSSTRICLGSVALFAGVFGSAVPVVAQRGPAIVAPGASPEQKSKLAELRARAVGDDRSAARAAFDEMKKMGDVARPTLVDALRLVLARDRDLLEVSARKATTGIGANLAALEADAATHRAAARAQIQKLTGPATARPARASYEKLRGVTARLADGYQSRSTLIDLTRHRPGLVALWAEVAPKTGPVGFDANQEAKLTATVRAALGEKLLPILEELQANPDQAHDPKSAAPEQDGLLAWRMNRKVDRYNQSLAGQIDPAEAELVRLINGYRENLGLPVLEVDARLLQAARRHSKEMAEQKYFGPTSPNEATKDAISRMKAAGFEVTGPWSEALARNTRSGTATFWSMFDVPHYHQAMTGEALTCVGAGKWDDYWTIELAAAPRLVLASDSERSGAGVEGEIVPPQSAAIRAERANNRPANDGNTDPTKIRPMIPGGGTPGVPSLPGLGL